MPVYADLPKKDKPTSIKLSRKVKRELKIRDLCTAMRRSSLVMQRYRENFKKMVRMIATAEWSDNASDKRRPWNGLGLYIDIVSRFLVNQNPRALLSTWRPDQQIVVKTAQDWGNKQFKRMRLGDHLQRTVRDGLLFMGIQKTGIVNPVESERMGFSLWAGEVFSMSVSPDDYLPDVFAKHFEDMGWE